MSNSGNGPKLLHGTVIALGTEAVLIRGPSGAGKSDLALRCLGLAPSALIPDQARLVADDQVLIEPKNTGLEATSPPPIRGKIEVRGIGIVTVETTPAARLVLVADLVTPSEVERFPLSEPRVSLLGSELPLFRLAAFETSSAIKLLLALERVRALENASGQR